MSDELKSGSIILSPDDAKDYEELKNMRNELIKSRYIAVYRSSFYPRPFIYMLSLLNLGVEKYEAKSHQEIISELQQRNDDLSDFTTKLIERNLWQRIINKLP